MKFFGFFLTCCLAVFMALPGQTPSFDIGIYKDFISANEDITPAQLYDLYPSGVFEAQVPEFDPGTVLFLDEMSRTYAFTADEKSLLMKNGFMVTERLRAGSYYSQYDEIYKKDLPVFVSADAILHAFHLSYDEILMQVEASYLIPELRKLLNKAHSGLENMDRKYERLGSMQPMLRDVDVYLTVARRLLGVNASAFYPENSSEIGEYMSLVESEKMEAVYFFSDDTCRDIDFSQFKPRGHYSGEVDEEEDYVTLREYFRAMMWLGRMELYLDHPDYDKSKAVRSTVHRQIVDAVLLHELFTFDDNAETMGSMEDIISFFVGEQDNVSPSGMYQLLEECGLRSAGELTVEDNLDRFLETLRNSDYGRQQILSQVFCGGKDGTSRPLPSVFMPFGQRFVIDSYVTGQVVYDRIIHDEENICRLVPSSLDILFALGNDAATQLLLPELHKWDYSDNLAGLRFLIDQYEDDFWESSLYNLWLHAIGSLNPDPSNEDLPAFMKTAAWGQEKMNTQLASWAELRHDNLLYAKQSYTSGGACSHPEGYVEPNPEFFRRMKRLAEIAGNKFEMISEQLNTSLGDFDWNPVNYFKDMYGICNTLQTIASKELAGEALSDAECLFLYSVTSKAELYGGCFGAEVSGWYGKLVFSEVDPIEPNLVVADYHTTPTDCFGNPLGWVSHAGTGLPDLAVVVAPLTNGELCAFAGPVASYHEFRTSEFFRINDTEWEEEYLAKSYRPDWVYNYLADGTGKKQEPGTGFFTSWRELGDALNMQTVSYPEIGVQQQVAISVAPNPVEDAAMITLKIPESNGGMPARLSVFDISGRMVRILVDGPMPAGYFITEWDCHHESGIRVHTGTYFLVWEQGDTRYIEKVMVAN